MPRRPGRPFWPALLFFLAAPAFAGKARPYLGIDFFAPANAGKGLEEDTRSAVSQVAGSGYNVSATVETKSAVGIRGGFIVPLDENFDLGASAGYVVGPDAEARLNATATGLSGVIVDERELRFFRFLVEPTMNARVNEKIVFHLGGGIGFASGRVEDRYTCTGNACLSGGSKYSASWTGLAWEFSPHFTVDRMLIGLRVAGFPPFKGNANQSKIDWTTAGLLAGVKF